MIDYNKVTKKALYEMVQEHEAQTAGNQKAIDAINVRLAQHQLVVNRAVNAEVLATRLRIELEDAKNTHAALLEKIGMAGLRLLQCEAQGIHPSGNLHPEPA